MKLVNDDVFSSSDFIYPGRRCRSTICSTDERIVVPCAKWNQASYATHSYRGISQSRNQLRFKLIVAKCHELTNIDNSLPKRKKEDSSTC